MAGDAALLRDPLDGDAWAEAVASVAADEALSGRLRAAGPVRAALFSWRAAARATLEVLRGAAGAPA